MKPSEFALALVAGGGAEGVGVAADRTEKKVSQAHAARLVKRWKLPKRAVRALMPRVVTRPSGLAVRASMRAQTRPRGRRAVGTSSSRGDPPDDPSPEPSALNRSWQAALEELDTATEFETLGELARIRAIWLEGVAA